MNNPQIIRTNLDDSVVSSFFDNNDFFLVYQKKVSLQDPDKLIGLETFLRLRTHSLEAYSPNVFMPVVKRLGMLGDLTRIIIRQVADDWNLLQLMKMDVDVSVNIELELFTDQGMLEEIVELMRSTAMPLQNLKIDLVLDKVSDITDSAKQGVNYLRKNGVGFSLDLRPDLDISETNIRELMVEEIKLSRGFFTEKNYKRAFMKYQGIAHELGLHLSAVGVEADEEIDLLLSSDVDYGQGFLFGRPTEIERLPDSQNSEEVLANNKLNILVIEQDQYCRKLLSSVSPETCQVNYVDNTTEALRVIEDTSPNIIIAEVNDASSSLFDMFVQYHALEHDDLFSVIFVSDSVDAKLHLKVFESNGFALLDKSAPIVEFISTINRAVSIQKKNKELLLKARESSERALQSMKDASQYGDIVQLMKKISVASNESRMARHLFNYMENRGLRCAVVFRDKQSVIDFDWSNASCSPTELKIFEILSNKGRLYEFGKRLIVNSEPISFLIKNMPANSTERGQIRDYVAVIIECMEARYRSVLQGKAIEMVLQDLVSISKGAIKSVEMAGDKKKVMVDSLNAEISMSFHVLDLTIEQEDYLKNLVSQLIEENDTDTEETNHIVLRLQSAIEILTSRLSKQEDEDEDEDDDIFDGDELF